MKHVFHIVFGAALFLGSLILFHNQKSECAEQTQKIPDLDQVELTAELPVLRSEVRIHPDRYCSMPVHQFIAGKLRNLSYLNNDQFQMRFKTQMNMYLELKPDLDFRSGQCLCHPARLPDPPLFSS